MSEDRGRIIYQFMWGYQSHFQVSAEVSLRMTLREVGFTGDVDVLLVGFQATGIHPFPICVEPEDGPFDPSILSNVLQGLKGQGLFARAAALRG